MQSNPPLPLRCQDREDKAYRHPNPRSLHSIEFAELEEFEERAFKQLSSGMKSRLAFSIASLVNPDILILDEVLSVGDGGFRKKSEAKMKSIINGGATTILVSHSIPQVRSMCNKILWLDRGRQITFGDDVNRICDVYENIFRTKSFPSPSDGRRNANFAKADIFENQTKRLSSKAI